jgi:deoxyuridine 5'-triphosphate nucleotidohydrolase
MTHEVPHFAFCRSTLSDHIDESFLPRKQNDNDTGFDVKACILDAEGNPSSLTLSPDQAVKIDLGLRVIAPPGWWLQLNPRSSTFAKLHLVSLVGVVDNGYEGPMMLAGKYLPPDNESITVKHGDRIGQLVPFRLEQMKCSWVSDEEFDQLSRARSNTRGTGGFGSSGTN